MWTSEALAFAVDEAVQVFGGNGYSREFPVERAYRDARITRIYEGTNEINRLIIPTRLLKQSAGVFTASTRSSFAQADGPLAAERDLLNRAKRLVVVALGQAAATYGDALKDEQEVLGHAADLVIEVYAVESALARTDKLRAASAADRSSVACDIARVYASDAADRLAHSGKQIAAALSAHGDSEPLGGLVREVATRPGIDTIAARRRIADAVIEAGRHLF